MNTPATKREMRSTGHGSDYFGKCELCDKHASEIFVSTSMTQATRKDGSVFWIKGGGTYGHNACLVDRFGAHDERQLRAK